MRRYLLLTLFIMLFYYCNSLFAQNYIRTTVVIDTPTAYTLNRGMYQFSFFGYDRGGVELKSFIGLHDNLFLGASFDIMNAIGKDEPEPNIPGVIAKLKFTDGWEYFPLSIAIGYDSFYLGEDGKTDNSNNKLNRMVFGPYFVITKPIYLFYDEQHLNFGIRLPTQPYYVPEDSSYFISLDIPLGDFFIFKAEGEKIYYNFSRNRDWLLNIGLEYLYLKHFGIGFAIMLQKKDQANRVLRIEYNDEF